MRIIPCFVLFVVAVPALAQQVHKVDFRDGKFDAKLLDYTLPNPEKYLTPEKEGLRLRFTGQNVPSAGQAAGIFWRFDCAWRFRSHGKVRYTQDRKAEDRTRCRCWDIRASQES